MSLKWKKLNSYMTQRRQFVDPILILTEYDSHVPYFQPSHRKYYWV